ncbi:DNA helicase RecQ [Balneolaceae bacterium YR4-1]|uniref:DNA helicase RecQ n=1 Tax=Halalkalibaculum roseum TaxID=2709311 RepID=A0A6M1T4U4_9BACT|nr:DNA helicase RecQ [Halalkalibaculum roseum]NGP75373.1 DNA helicase RecQ [Halalkalibaculum roseum]
MIKEAKKKLNDVFGYETFRPLQEEVIEQVLNKKDALVIMPTGGGKSLCYQIPAIIFDGLTIVVSPLISLMKDQVEQLHQFDIPAVYLNSSLTPEEYQANIEKLKKGSVDMLYLAPETLLMPKTRELLSGLDIDCFTIDEAHCISEWGHDFRPEYRQLVEVRKDFPDAACLALTATATPRVREDIKQTLGMKDSETYLASFDRKNLFLKVADKDGPTDQVLDFLYTRKKQSGIIYCFSRRQVDELYVDLKKEGHSVKPYHAGLSETVRNRNQEAFIRDDVNIIVATIAFGMGINKPDVRFVVHYDMPKNIESYYQQIGRAGRDGLRADCLLLFSYSDTQKIRYFINQKEDEEKKIAEQHLKSLLKFLEATECRRKPLLNYFGEEYEKDECGMCDNCLSLDAEVEDLTVQAQKYLSCIVRTDETYGANYIADVLRGSKSKKVLENDHNELSTYGIGMEWSKDQWVQLSRLLLRQDYLEKDQKYGSLKLKEQARNVLNGHENVFGTLDRTAATVNGKAVDRTSSDVENKYDEKLFEQLREKRKELADQKGIPPYTIFPDTTLMEMSYYFPQNEEHMMQIYGVGSAKLKRYGDIFGKIIKEYTDENEIEERVKTLKKKAKKSSSKKKHVQIAEAFNEGQSIEHLAEQYGVKDVTIIKHLKTYLEEGNSLRTEGIAEASELSVRKRDEVMESMDRRGPELLRVIYNDMDKEVGYSELRILQLYYMAANQE